MIVLHVGKPSIVELMMKVIQMERIEKIARQLHKEGHAQLLCVSQWDSLSKTQKEFWMERADKHLIGERKNGS